MLFEIRIKECPGGGIGRHAGLKILWTVMSVPVRPRPGALSRGVKRKLLRLTIDGLLRLGP